MVVTENAIYIPRTTRVDMYTHDLKEVGRLDTGFWVPGSNLSATKTHIAVCEVGLDRTTLFDHNLNKLWEVPQVGRVILSETHMLIVGVKNLTLYDLQGELMVRKSHTVGGLFGRLSALGEAGVFYVDGNNVVACDTELNPTHTTQVEGTPLSLGVSADTKWAALGVHDETPGVRVIKWGVGVAMQFPCADPYKVFLKGDLIEVHCYQNGGTEVVWLDLKKAKNIWGLAPSMVITLEAVKKRTFKGQVEIDAQQEWAFVYDHIHERLDKVGLT